MNKHYGNCPSCGIELANHEFQSRTCLACGATWGVHEVAIVDEEEDVVDDGIEDIFLRREIVKFNGERFDFLNHLHKQCAWSYQTFGPGFRKGVIQHLKKEIKELEAEPYDMSEWCDIIILGLDGAMRLPNVTPEMVIEALQAKLAKNMARTWPDWRLTSPDEAIEHDRSKDECCGRCDGVNDICRFTAKVKDDFKSTPFLKDILDTLAPDDWRRNVVITKGAALGPTMLPQDYKLKCPNCGNLFGSEYAEFTECPICHGSK